MTEATLIPAIHADIYWNDEPGHRTGGSEVLVLDHGPNGEPRSHDSDPKHLDNSIGAMSAGWCEDGHPLHNPAGVFARNWLIDGSSSESIRAALREFAKIKECNWAREMLACIEWTIERRSE